MGEAKRGWCEGKGVRNLWLAWLYSWPPLSPPLSAAALGTVAPSQYSLSIQGCLQNPHMTTVPVLPWRRGQKGTQGSPMVQRGGGDPRMGLKGKLSWL